MVIFPAIWRSSGDRSARQRFEYAADEEGCGGAIPGGAWRHAGDHFLDKILGHTLSEVHSIDVSPCTASGQSRG